MIYTVTRFQDDPDTGHSMVVDGDQLDGMLAEFRTDPGIPEGAGMLIRRTDYMAPVERAVRYINRAETREQRLERKSEVFHILYGNDALRASYGDGSLRDVEITRHQGTVTGRMVVSHPTLRVVDHEK
jgi:hypothetical protein